MEEENNKIAKTSSKAAIIIICVFLLLIIIMAFYINKLQNIKNSAFYNSAERSETKTETKTRLNTFSVEKYNGKIYCIIESDYTGEYDLQFLDLTDYRKSLNELNNNFSIKKTMNYEEYKSYCNKWGIKTKYSDSSKNYIVFSYYSNGSPILKARFGGIEYNNNDANLYIWDYSDGLTVDIAAYVLVVPTEKDINSINIVPLTTPEEFENVKKRNETRDLIDVKIDKPIIYLYPTEETQVSVKVGNPENLTHTYPKYENGWNVIAKPNGELKDIKTGRNLYALYWEGINTAKPNMNEGFIAKGEDTISFLEEKLAILGLNEREAEEFIVYWLPKLESNKYNFIRFETMEEINESMPLKITPTPDTIIRVIMEFKGIDEPFKVQEQKLETPVRDGFTVVEWGGTEIN